MNALVLVAFNFATLDDGTNVATLTTGGEHGVVVGAGYDRVVTVADQPVVAGVDVTLAPGAPDDVRVEAGLLTPVLAHGRWRVLAGVAAVATHTNDDLARMVSLGTDTVVLAGRYTRAWFAAGELGFQWSFATHVTHSNDYRMLVYPDARDGWYGNTAALLRAGVQAGVTFGGNDLVVRAGMVRDDSGHAPLLPIYATLGYDRRW